ncbi:MAG: hypothetical protein IKC86_06165 [Prevotella sp.]|nr:hypothetical protein [Prevotella sp.]
MRKGIVLLALATMISGASIASEPPVSADTTFNRFRVRGYGEIVAQFKDYGINRFNGTDYGNTRINRKEIGEPYRLYQSGKTTEALYAVESWYSWHSREDYRNNIYSIRNAYYGSLNGTVNANSISALTAKYNPSLDKKVKAAIDAAANAIMDIPQPFRNNINSAEANAAMEACADLQDVLEKDLKSFLTNHTR